jgi:asparagine synthase (glutamine-hydrolysing)
MCGIAGMADLAGERAAPRGALEAMARALFHRGPDDGGFLQRPGLGLVSRRLSIVGLSDGRQPLTNEDGSVWVVFNGELFDYPEERARLEARGHRFRTHCDTELVPHLWEDHGEEMFSSLRGQFALALWDDRRRMLVVGRDRFGICPLFWTRQTTRSGEWLLFASEIKALLATGMVPPRPDARGINHVFTFFALPGPVTCFEGVQALMPGHFLSIDFARRPGKVTDRTYWRMDFPDRGQESSGTRRELVDGMEAVLRRAVARRLRADVPVVSYLSGGVDSSLVVALAARERGRPVPTFTIQIDDPDLDETGRAAAVARHVGSKTTVVRCGAAEVLANYPHLIQAAEGPVIDTACAALLLLAQEVHAQGYKVALTGEGADEWLAGYPWFKSHKLLGYLDVVPGLRLSQLARRAYLRLTGSPRFPWALARRVYDAVGGPNAWLDVYGLMSLSKLRFYSRRMHEEVGDHLPYADLGLDLDRMSRWHPLNRSLYLGARVMLPGLLLASKGDRVAMHSSVETRYPFLDLEVFDFLARLHPRWKMRGFREKYVLRRVAERWLPREVAWRPKAMFRAPFDSFHLDRAPSFVEQLLSEESLVKTGYFDAHAVTHWRQSFRNLRAGSPSRASVEMGLVGVLATQLWHHTFIDPSLADLPSIANLARPALAAS